MARPSRRLIARQKRFPDIAIVSEENAASQSRAAPERFFLVDPLDGTRAFLRGGPDFCVLIALIECGVPIAAALDAPARGKRYWSGRHAFVASTNAGDAGKRLPVRTDASLRTAIISTHHASESSRKLCAALGVETVLTENSALKFARVAEGEADLYPRAGTTMEWDIAAGDAILRAVGGGVTDLAGTLMRYGLPGTSWEVPGFIARGRLA
jgi:3'(2'), 5'-bisphosphate nucleotidase